MVLHTAEQSRALCSYSVMLSLRSNIYKNVKTAENKRKILEKSSGNVCSFFYTFFLTANVMPILCLYVHLVFKKDSQPVSFVCEVCKSS